MFMKHIKIRNYEIGLHFRDGEFQGLLAPGIHWLLDPLGQAARRHRLAARSVAGPREARHDRPARAR